MTLGRRWARAGPTRRCRGMGGSSTERKRGSPTKGSHMWDEWAGLAGKVAVVTGGAGGLGRAATLALAGAGMSVAVCDRDPDALAGIGPMLEAIGVPSHLATFDVRDSDALAGFFGEVDRQFGGPDVLVNIPGGGFRKRVIDMTPNGTNAVIQQ